MNAYLKSSIINRLFLGLFIILIIAKSLISIPISVFVILALLWLLITTIGSFNILWNYHIDSLNFQSKPEGKKIALTFDDGPHPEYTTKILKVLKKYNAKATFFCVGKHIEAHPEMIQKIAADGHSIGNHSYSHSDFFDFYSAKRILNELNRTNQLVKDLIQKRMKLFRPPYGVTNPSIKKALNRSKHTSIGWNVRSLDTVLKVKKKIYHRITDRLKAGDIVLLHDTMPQTLDVLEEILIFLQKNQFEMVSVDTLLNIKAYEENE